MYKRYIKRIFDIIISLVLLPVVIFVIAISGIAIKIEDSGPIFYKGTRLGRNMVKFKMIKLRTMKENAEDIRNPDGSTYNSPSDPRLTKVGSFLRKTSIDELPQIINVIKGDMSLIGPRPNTPMAVDSKNLMLKKKMSIRPGITGYSQAYFRNSLVGVARYEKDYYYVENLSFVLDVKIIFKSFITVLKREKVYNDNTTNNNS